MIDPVIGARLRELSETDRVRLAQLPVGENSPARSERIGARGGLDRGPRSSSSHYQVRYQRLSSLNQKELRRERERGTSLFDDSTVRRLDETRNVPMGERVQGLPSL